MTMGLASCINWQPVLQLQLAQCHTYCKEHPQYLDHLPIGQDSVQGEQHHQPVHHLCNNQANWFKQQVDSVDISSAKVLGDSNLK